MFGGVLGWLTPEGEEVGHVTIKTSQTGATMETVMASLNVAELAFGGNSQKASTSSLGITSNPQSQKLQNQR